MKGASVREKAGGLATAGFILSGFAVAGLASLAAGDGETGPLLVVAAPWGARADSLIAAAGGSLAGPDAGGGWTAVSLGVPAGSIGDALAVLRWSALGLCGPEGQA